MKKLMISFAVLAMVVVTTLGLFSFSLSGPSYVWELTTYDFGKIKKGIPVSVTFNFHNSGDAPLIIKEAKSGCGCTTAEYIKDAVVPAAKGFVKLTFNAEKIGKFSKSVAVTSNVSGNPVNIIINGEVVN